ncbi:MAG: MBOAT family protein [Bacteroidetes bacterium]|nr:MBOAT family protein [Bacteroidota bacterium]
MVFSSVIFLVYFLPIFLTIYFLVPKSFKNPVLLLSSIFFYAWGAPLFIFAILLTTTVDFYFVKLLNNAADDKKRKLWLILSLSLNVGMLFYFKYCNFFIENVNTILNAAGMQEVSWTKVVLPIGISFYTFESITYVVDVYRRLHKPLDNFWQYQLYIICFPKLIAGPIIRYHEISDQIADRSANDTIDNKLTGFYRFCLGLGKKVLIANVMAAKADEIFNMPPTELTTSLAWLGMLAYTFQIYFDFSGYSDMALGIGKMIGFKFPENFDNPYTSQSITEFWRRWHMTLGSWMKSYLYIPLGGNKVESKKRLYFNLWLVFLASGFWHGAAWTFIIWGIYHGFWLVLERMFLADVYKKIGKLASTLICFVLVAIGWVFFRADTTAGAFNFVQQLFTFNFSMPPHFVDNEFTFYFGLAIVFSFFASFRFGQIIQNKVYYSYYGNLGNLLATVVAISLFTLSLASITSSGFNPFIYFRF